MQTEKRGFLLGSVVVELVKFKLIDKVVVTNSLPLPADPSEKVVQLSIAPMLADVILAEHFRQQSYDDDDVSEDVRAEDF